MPTAVPRRPSAAPRPSAPAGPLAALGKWLAPDDGSADELAGKLADAKREAAVLRVAAGEADPRRLLAGLHKAAGAKASAASLLLDADGPEWRVLLSAGAQAGPQALAGLPRPSRVPDRAEPITGGVGPLAAGWLAPLGSGEGRRLFVLGGPLPDGGDAGRGRRLAEILAAAVDRAAAAEAAAARTGRTLAVQAAQVAVHEAAAAAGDAGAVLGAVLEKLVDHAGATHAALLTTAPQVRRLAAAGPTGSNPVEVLRLANDHKLAAWRRDGEPAGVFEPFDAAALKAAGVESLCGRAARVDVPGAVPAALVLSRTDAAPFAEHHEEIAAWAGRFVGQLLPRVSATAAVRRQASRDALTGLANRATFEDRLAEFAAAANAGGDDLTLLMCDLDHFKQVNDTHGHQVGDGVLVATADAFRAVLAECRKGDKALPCRYGGEELCVLLAGFGRAGADRVAERLRAAVATIGAGSGGELPDVTVSIGAALLPDHAGTPADLIKVADAALYAAKHGGRNRVQWAGGPAGDVAALSAAPAAPARVAPAAASVAAA